MTVSRAAGMRCRAGRLLALATLVALPYSPVAALSARRGRRPSRRNAARGGAEPGREYSAAAPRENQPELSSGSPAFSSALFASLSRRRDRGRRRLRAAECRGRLLARERNLALYYKDHDDDLSDLLYPQQNPSRRGIFRWRMGKSVSKGLVPQEVMPHDKQDDVIDAGVKEEDVVKEEMMQSPTSVFRKPAMGIAKIRRRKKEQVTVTNIEELHEAILDKGFELRDIELNYSPPPSLLSSKKQREEAHNKVDGSELPQSGKIQLELVTGELACDHVNSTLVQLSAPEIMMEDNDEPSAEEWQLIGNVLAEDAPFPTQGYDEDVAQGNKVFSHDVLNLLHQRYRTRSKPSRRAPSDTSKLALSIEGGGMRGAVSGGMAAAVACLGLSDAFDAVYGSSAGSIIGSYFVSRQLYLDVYTDVIPAGKNLFVSKARIIGDIFVNLFHAVKGPLGKRLGSNLIERFRSPDAGLNNTQASTADALPPTRAGGLNISFVLDSIMCPERGLRPLDMEAFAHNDAAQPLRIVSSAVEVETGKLKSVIFGSREGHFRDQFTSPSADPVASPREGPASLYPEIQSAAADGNGRRRGMWACLGAGMTVPGAAGPPFRMDLPSGKNSSMAPHLCFDAFCYEPVPFRSAVAEGATHVVALRSNPAGFEPKTRPTLYERAVAPLYFRSNGADTVAGFFKKGGQQYLYAEDVLLCDRGLDAGGAVPIPPARVLYAAPGVQAHAAPAAERGGWAQAHLLPITVPADIPELSTLSQDRDDILAGIRSGFAAAYDMLAPVVGLETGPDLLDGSRIAELVFPEMGTPHESVLEEQLPLVGEKLGETFQTAPGHDAHPKGTMVKETVAGTDLSSTPRCSSRFGRLRTLCRGLRLSRRFKNHAAAGAAMSSVSMNDSTAPAEHADTLLSFLPGVQLGSVPLVEKRLQTYLENHSYLKD